MGSGVKKHRFREKLLLNQWMLSLFGIDPLNELELHGQTVQPFQVLANTLKHYTAEGLGSDNLHYFYHSLVASNLLSNSSSALYKEQILLYEENIVRHTQSINDRRSHNPVVWKYFQWLSLLFVEIYLDHYFGNRENLHNQLNEFVNRFNKRWHGYPDVPYYSEDDLNKLCVQNATGSGKTLIMHINLLQFQHYVSVHRKDKNLSRVILLTPNERLSEQHIVEFKESSISVGNHIQSRRELKGISKSLEHVDVLEITKLKEQEGPETIATRSLGDQNLLLVDEGHRGMNAGDTGAWFSRRSELCARGFTFEYSATFEQAIGSANNLNLENSYAKSVIFDYSYRWFYEDGYGKDYRILNLPISLEDIRNTYLTACLLKFYQQLRVFEDGAREFEQFNLEKPLWVFVGNTVSKVSESNATRTMATDVAEIIIFIARFLSDRSSATQQIKRVITGSGNETGLLDSDGSDIFAKQFSYLAKAMKVSETEEDLYEDILARLFNHSSGGQLLLDRLKGASGEVALRAGNSELPFGLVNVGDAKGLSDHVEKVAEERGYNLTIQDSEFTESMFASVKYSTSPINLLIGSKKFVEGWDCWRVSTMGLMHVGQREGAQIIQLFGRGVRLKGYGWSLKRSNSLIVQDRPNFIDELETLNVFGIRANFMENFRDYLNEEGLSVNQNREIIDIPLKVTYEFGKELKILRSKSKSNGEEYDFKKDGPAQTVNDVPDYMTKNKVVSDWYPRISAMQSTGIDPSSLGQKNLARLTRLQLALLDYNALFFELERYKNERNWHNLNITKQGIHNVLENSNWYTLYLPETFLHPKSFVDVRFLQQVAIELLKRYCERYYNFRKRECIEPHLELRELTEDDENIPKDEFYQVIVDSDELQLIQAIKQIKMVLEQGSGEIPIIDELRVLDFGKHLFQPLLSPRRGGKITNRPVALNESEYQFVNDLKQWYENNESALEKEGADLFLLRNMSRGKGVGFFEAGNFHPDFILWMLVGGKQYVTFVEPHGLVYEGSASEKIMFHKRIKNVEKRLKDSTVILNSFILSWTPSSQLKWGMSRDELEEMNVLFMVEDQEKYLDKLFAKLRKNRA